MHPPQDGWVKPRQNDDVSEVKTGRVFEQGGLKIDVLGLDKHLKRWDWHHPARSRFLFRTLVAAPGEEIAVVRVRTTIDGAPPPCFASLVLYEARGGSYEAPLQNFCIGYPGDKVVPPVGEMEYEFPFIIAKGAQASAWQFRRDVNSAARSESRAPTLTFELTQVKADK